MAYKALIPSILGHDWWESWDYPSRIMDQLFGTQLCDRDLLSPTMVRGYLFRPRSQASLAASGQSEVTNDDRQFHVSLNVSQFKPEELHVKVVDRYVVVHGKHDERSDEHGLVSREFTRRYMLPEACEPDAVASSLSPEGLLTIIAAKKALEKPPKQERNVPIQSEAKGDEAVTKGDKATKSDEAVTKGDKATKSDEAVTKDDKATKSDEAVTKDDK